MHRSVAYQPEALRGHEYRAYALEDYQWFELTTRNGAVYAVVGVVVANGEAWAYWRILKPGLLAWKELTRQDVPWFREYVRERGARMIFVASNDPQDVNFEKMVGIMGFNTTKMGWQTLEADHVR